MPLEVVVKLAKVAPRPETSLAKPAAPDTAIFVNEVFGVVKVSTFVPATFNVVRAVSTKATKVESFVAVVTFNVLVSLFVLVIVFVPDKPFNVRLSVSDERAATRPSAKVPAVPVSDRSVKALLVTAELAP